MKDEKFSSTKNPNETLYDLASKLLKEFKLFPQSDLPPEIKTVGSSLLAASKAIEEIRSKSTTFHGKTNDDYVVDDALYTYFIINSVTTIGLFLKSFYKLKYPKLLTEDISNNDDLPF